MSWWKWLLFGAVAAEVLIVVGLLGWGYWVLRRDSGRGMRA
jgi:predicted negative regulator of RcsB-dependent stress response